MKTDLGTTVPLNDRDIISLHRALVTPGLHHIKGFPITLLREVLADFFKVSFLYRSPACLSLYDLKAFPCNVINLTDVINTYLESNRNNHALAVLSMIPCDFIWIEMDASLLEKPWYQRLIKYTLPTLKRERMPIICVDIIDTLIETH
jgi:hypothetical protein